MSEKKKKKTDKSSSCVGQNHLPSCQQGETCHDEKGDFGFLFLLIPLIIYLVLIDFSCFQEAILVNCSRGPVIDEVALVNHLRENPMFRVGLDVFEEEPFMKPGLADMKNAIVVPHIASASKVCPNSKRFLCVCLSQ